MRRDDSGQDPKVSPSSLDEGSVEIHCHGCHMASKLGGVLAGSTHLNFLRNRDVGGVASPAPQLENCMRTSELAHGRGKSNESGGDSSTRSGSRRNTAVGHPRRSTWAGWSRGGSWKVLRRSVAVGLGTKTPGDKYSVAGGMSCRPGRQKLVDPQVAGDILEDQTDVISASSEAG